jgi:transcriptional/translational regulatory protein YebC/TACO1
MKRYFCFFLAVLITAMSIIFYCPFNIYANDAFTISKNSTEKTGLSADEAQKAIDANADIKGKDGVTMLLYTPSDSYNYTLKSGAFVAHLSDSQAKAMLMSKKSFQQYVVLCSSLISNGTVFRGFLKTVGIATTGDSNALTNIVDKFTCNYNYLDSINYDEDTQTITMDNTSVDKLREEIKKYYYDLIGLCQWKPSGTVKSFVDSSEYRKNFEFEEDYQNAYYSKSKYCIASSYANYALFFDDKFDYMYLSNSEKKNLYYDGWHIDFYKLLYRDGSDFSSKLVGEDKKGLITRYDANPLTNVTVAALYYHASYPQKMALSPSFILGSDGSTYDDMYVKYYSADGSPLLFFKSYSAYYDFINGDQNAYLSSTIEKTGEDITFSIKDMNENLGNKMDTLIDSINSNKSNMSADELQNAIDKGLEDLNKNTEDIKDNTSDILDTLKEQNNILLQILGVTEYIAYQNDKYNNTYTKADMSNLFKKSFNRVSDAVLYGEKVDDDNENTVDRSKFSYHNGIFGHFPFSVPYQLYEWLKILQSEPICPEFTYHYGFLIGISKDSDEYDKYKITFNLSAYDSWREVAASFLKLAFTLTMAIGTYKKFKGEL